MIKPTLVSLALCLSLTLVACSSSKPSTPQGKTSDGSNLPAVTETIPPSELTQ